MADALDKANAALAQAEAGAIREAAAAEAQKQSVRADIAAEPIRAVMVAFGIGVFVGVLMALVLS